MVMIRRPRDGALLVSESRAPSGELFHRPLGGHVEFGEYAATLPLYPAGVIAEERAGSCGVHR
jgi:hypothetical protein